MKPVSLLAAALLAATLAACAGGPAATKSEAPAKAAAVQGVEARAQKRWELLIAGKAAEAYDYFTPGYRQVKDRDTFASDMAVRPVHWTQASVTGSTCPPGEQLCDVTVEVHYSIESSLPGVGTIQSVSPVEERWIETEGNWYFVPKEVARK